MIKLKKKTTINTIDYYNEKPMFFRAPYNYK